MQTMRTRISRRAVPALVTMSMLLGFGSVMGGSCCAPVPGVCTSNSDCGGTDGAPLQQGDPYCSQGACYTWGEN